MCLGEPVNDIPNKDNISKARLDSTDVRESSLIVERRDR